MPILLETTELTKQFGERLLFRTPPLRIYEGDRIGLVGPNGSGKSSLLAVLAGELEPDEGAVRRRCAVTLARQLGQGEEPPAPEELSRFGLRGNQPPPERMSGGEQERRKLAAALGGRPALLFADEPTSNLDWEGIRLLCKRLEDFPTFLLVSHDRAVLEQLCSQIWELREGKLFQYEGSFSAFQAQRQEELERRRFEAEAYEKEKKRLEHSVQALREKASSVRKAPTRMGNSEARLHKRSSTNAQAKISQGRKILETRLERLEKKEAPREQEAVRFDFSLTNPPENKVVLRAEDVSLSQGGKTLLEHARLELKKNSRTLLFGPNGCGKTTLLNWLYQGIAEGGPGLFAAPKLRVGYFRQSLENIDLQKSVLENVMASSVQTEGAVRALLARLLFRREDVYKPAGVLSGGERVKLSFACLLASPVNFLFLDEPTNYLDMDSMDALRDTLLEYEGGFLLVSHDRSFADALARRTLVFQGKRLLPFDGGPSAWEAAQTAPKPAPKPMALSVVELRLAEVISRLSLPNCQEKERLEEEFQELLRQKRELSVKK